MKYRIERGEGFGDTKVFTVYDPPDRYGYQRPVDVWFDGNSCRCCSCSSILIAMSRSCQHAKAVRRFLAKAEQPQ